MPHPTLPLTALARLTLAFLLALPAARLSHAGAGPASFAGHWEDCHSVPGTCFGYALGQTGTQVCGSLSVAPQAASAPRQVGHIQGVASEGLLTQVQACGAESRSPCPNWVVTNRRGLLRCDDTMNETGGRRYTCPEWAAQRLPTGYQRVSAEAFTQRFGPLPASLCGSNAPEPAASGSGH